MGSSCFARGNKANLELIEKFITLHGLDEKIELTGSLCEGKCSSGPNIKIDGKTYMNIDKAMLIDALNKNFAEEIKEAGSFKK